MIRKIADAAPPRRQRLDRLQVLQAAREVCGRQGIGQLSIRALADRLRIRPPSVYAHFDGLPAIRRELALWGHRALAERLRDSAVGLAGAEALMACGRAYLAFIRQEPGLYSATVATPSVDDVELRAAANEWLSVFYRLLAGLGLDDEAQIHALRGVRSIVHGFGLLEADGAFRTGIDRQASFEQVLRTFVLAIARPGA